eukprot:CAMPEP_0201574748 /NCGR_PEP_ID=MMETSP0190_2-20130828/19442_1 /ASSEMBLY_ACC=CAM_ASM_000263 /TAXON_ID=37353 /ORGANISM="Rosalina sp." /LENGTH=584 /DNA_ID=CAMNT_0048003447 /DNA_START=108 /DNA_END=1859 /DNA_ORIENTATION=-
MSSDKKKASEAQFMIPWQDSYDLGVTVDSKTGIPKAVALSGDSLKSFRDAFKTREEKHDAEPGEYQSNSTLATTSEQHDKALSIGANLSVEYGPVSASVSAKFVQENTASSLDITYVFHAKTDGSYLTGDTTDLKVSDTVAKLIKEKGDKMTLGKFTRLYGDVIIVGKEYSGEIFVTRQYSCTTQSSKQKLEASLSAEYGKAGFSVKGSVDVGMSKNDQTDKVTVSQSKKFSGCDGDSEEAKQITEAIASVGGPNENKDWAAIVEKNAQMVLTGGRLRPSAAIILPVISVPAVSDTLAVALFNSDDGDDAPGVAIKKYPLLNALYYGILSIQKGAEAMKTRLETLIVDKNNADLHDEAGKLSDYIATWQDKLAKLKNVLVQAGDDDETLAKWQKEESESKDGGKGDDKDGATDDSKDGEIDKEIPYVSAPLLKNEWFNKVVIQYNKIMDKYNPPLDPVVMEAKDINLTGQYYQGQVLVDNTDIITCGRDVKNVIINITWNDQKWGNLKGEIWMRVLSASNGGANDYSVGKATHAKATISKEFPNADFPADKLPKRGDQVSFVRLIGGGGGHELHIETFTAVINW